MKITTNHPNPNPLIDPLLPVIQAQALIAAVRLKIFETIGLKKYSLEEIAGNLNLSKQGLRKILDLLCAMGYLGYSESHYHLKEVTAQTLLPGSPFRFTGWIEFCRLQHQAAVGLEEAVRTGQPYDMETLLSKPW